MSNLEVLLDLVFEEYDDEDEAIQAIVQAIRIRKRRLEASARAPESRSAPGLEVLPVGAEGEVWRLYGFTESESWVPVGLVWGVSAPDGTERVRALTQQEVDALPFEVAIGPDGDEGIQITLQTGEVLWSDYQRNWPQAWTEALESHQAISEQDYRERSHIWDEVARQRREDPERLARIERAREGSWGAWLSLSGPPVEFESDPRPPPGWVWRRYYTPGELRSRRRHAALHAWIDRGGTPPWELPER